MCVVCTIYPAIYRPAKTEDYRSTYTAPIRQTNRSITHYVYRSPMHVRPLLVYPIRFATWSTQFFTPSPINRAKKRVHNEYHYTDYYFGNVGLQVECSNLLTPRVPQIIASGHRNNHFSIWQHRLAILSFRSPLYLENDEVIIARAYIRGNAE